MTDDLYSIGDHHQDQVHYKTLNVQAGPKEASRAKLIWHVFSSLNFFLTFPKYLLSVNCISQSVQSLGHVPLFAAPWNAAHQASLSITNSQSFLRLMSIELVMPSSHLIFCCPLLLLPSIFPSIMVFSNESVLRIRQPKYWSFSFSISLSNEYPGLISFRIDWLDLLAVQGTPKSLFQHHSSKASILWLDCRLA